MKTISILVASLFAATSLFSQIPNAGFESWTNTSGFNSPDGWASMNPMTASTNTFTCLKGTPGSPGASYLKLISKSVTGMGVVPGIAVSGTIDPATHTPTSGFAYNSRPSALAGKWQYMATGADQGFISIYFTLWNAAMTKRDTIGKALKLLPGMAMSWASFSIPITYQSTEFPDSCIIVFSASGSTPVATSYLYVDGLSFTGVVTSVTPQNQARDISLFPNPVSGQFQLDLSGIDEPVVSILIQDVMGKEIQTLPVSGLKTPSFNAMLLSPGIYFIQVKTWAQTRSIRFMKE